MLTGAYDPFEATVHQELTPPELRARVFALLLAAEMTAVPIAMLAYGFLIGAAGVRAAFLFFAVGNTLLGAYAIRSGAGDRLDRGRSRPLGAAPA